MNYGVIIHYGVYSYYGYDDVSSAKRRNVQNGSEWYYGRLIDTNTFRPISGQSFTKKYHEKNFGVTDYFENVDKIMNNEKTVREKVRMWIEKSGASYIILTSKHHDGLCLWDTKTTSRKSKVDICKIFSEECKIKGISFGFYYSWFEFDKSFTVDYFEKYCEPQLAELLKYNPKYLWFDGQWKITQKSIKSKILMIVKDLVSNGILINDRIGGDDFSMCSYRVFSDRFIPTEKLDIKWQHVNTIGYSWGYNQEQKKEDYKNGKEIYDLYKKINKLGGELLLNIGPMANGDICPEELKVLEYLNCF